MRDARQNPEIPPSQYFHRAVGRQMVHCEVKSFLGVEWQLPVEGEVSAALRLLGRLEQQYGRGFVDIILLDALYAHLPFLTVFSNPAGMPESRMRKKIAAQPVESIVNA